MIDAKTVEEVKAKHPETALRLLSAGGYEVIVKTPGVEYDRFKAEREDDRKKLKAVDRFFRSCVVYPDPKAVDDMLARKPALADRFAVELFEMAGLAEQVEKKDL